MKEIKSHSNEYIKSLKLLKRKKARDDQGRYMIEGFKTIEEAVRCGQELECILTSEPNSGIAGFARKNQLKLISVPHDIIQQIADTKSPPHDLACVLKKQNRPDVTGNFFVAMDDVNDPKNLGTIIRTADAAGADGILISQTSADFYGPKAQRAAMGSTFHVPIAVGELPAMLKRLKEEGVSIVSGCLDGSYELPACIERVCVVIGNEARGISQEVRELSDIRYKIRIYGQAESLNASVAAGIMLYDVRKILDR
jgi:TrmH family RNA methyltransferase